MLYIKGINVYDAWSCSDTTYCHLKKEKAHKLYIKGRYQSLLYSIKSKLNEWLQISFYWVDNVCSGSENSNKSM